MDTKVIFIDWHGTLSRSMFWQDLQLSHPDVFEQIQTILFKSNTHIITDWMRGVLCEDDVIDYLVNHDIKDRALIKNRLRRSCENVTFIHEDILEVIQKLRSQNYLCVIATDNMDVFSKYTVPAYNLQTYFDDIINSSQVKALKSDISEKEELTLFFLSIHTLISNF